MGILNVTPDSFYDGGKYQDPEQAVAHGLALAAAGADIIDIGGESTRPGAHYIDEEEELRRVMPVIERLVDQVQVPLSVDTRKAGVARRAIAAGVQIVNDVSALRSDPRLAPLIAESGVSVVLMHMQGDPLTMQQNPTYTDVVEEILAFFRERIAYALAQGISPEQIIIDPGIGFGKRLVHNLEILRHLPRFRQLGFPVMLGHSRKGFMYKALGLPPAERLAPTIAIAVLAMLQGVNILRVHDVKEMVQARNMIAMILDPGRRPR
ncbi:MAG: dihydropteroate synthase [Nitrospinota bacterium]|nr:MAG: dihydropteroate synthase [Nitrospinota bacterium]